MVKFYYHGKFENCKNVARYGILQRNRCKTQRIFTKNEFGVSKQTTIDVLD
jgi:hypothetical protein